MDVDSTVRFLEEKWHTGWGLLVALTLASGTSFLFVPDTPSWRLVGASLTSVIVAVWWFLGRRPRRTKRGHVGIVIALTSGGTAESRRVRHDFVSTFKKLLIRGRAGSTFDVIVLPEHLAERVGDSQQAGEMQGRTRAHLVLYGTVKTGYWNDKPAHSVVLDGLVKHAPIPESTRAKFGNEFGELLPRKVLIGMGNDLIGFDFLSAWTQVATKYIVGMAAAFSGELDYAASIFEDLQKEIHASPSEPPAVARIRGQLPKRLAEVNTLRASRSHRRWLDTKDAEDLAAMGRFSDLVPDQFVKQIGATNLKALWLFMGSRQAEKALRLIEQNGVATEPTWLFNRAFLNAYRGNLKRAYRLYRKAEGPEPNLEVLRHVDEFLDWLLVEEPNSARVLFCRGVISWRIRGDLVAAERDLQEFVVHCSSEGFVEEKRMVESWLVEIRRALTDVSEGVA